MKKSQLKFVNSKAMDFTGGGGEWVGGSDK